MNTQEAIKHLESLGFKIYPKGDKFAIWWPNQKNNDEDLRYTSRQLIHIARIKSSPSKPCGGKKVSPCPCCSISNGMAKKLSKRANRRKAKKEIDLE